MVQAIHVRQMADLRREVSGLTDHRHYGADRAPQHGGITACRQCAARPGQEGGGRREAVPTWGRSWTGHVIVARQDVDGPGPLAGEVLVMHSRLARTPIMAAALAPLALSGAGVASAAGPPGARAAAARPVTVYVANGGSGTVTPIRAATNTALEAIRVGGLLGGC
jgi:hypothetical protein